MIGARPGRQLCPQAALDLFDARQHMAMAERNVSPREFAPIAPALAQQIWRARRHVGQRGQRMQPGCRRQFGDGQDLRPGARQLDGHLQVQRPVAGDQQALSRQHAITAQQGLGRPGGHDAGQCPARHRQAALIGARRDDQALWPAEDAGAAIEDHEVERFERAPDLAAGHHGDARCARTGDQRPAAGELRVIGNGSRHGRRVQTLFEELAASNRPFIHQQHLGPGLGRRDRGVQPAGTTAQHENFRRQEFACRRS